MACESAFAIWSGSVENYDPEEEREDDRCPECKTHPWRAEEPGMEPTPFCNCCAHAVVCRSWHGGATTEAGGTPRRSRARR